jgi:hypothetical protein
LLCDFHVPELAPDARQAFAEGLVDESMLDLQWLEEELFQRAGESLKSFRQRNAPIDAVAECSRWLCFRDEDEDLEPWQDPDDIDTEERPDDAWACRRKDLPDLPFPTPYIAPPKVAETNLPLRQRQENKNAVANERSQPSMLDHQLSRQHHQLFQDAVN